MKTIIKSDDHDPYAEYRTKYKALMTSVVRVLSKSGSLRGRK